MIRSGAGIFYGSFYGDADTESCESWPLVITPSTPTYTTPPTGSNPPPLSMNNPFNGANPAASELRQLRDSESQGAGELSMELHYRETARHQHDFDGKLRRQWQPPSRLQRQQRPGPADVLQPSPALGASSWRPARPRRGPTRYSDPSDSTKATTAPATMRFKSKIPIVSNPGCRSAPPIPGRKTSWSRTG